MNRTKEERLAIGEILYYNQMSKADVMLKYNISSDTARKYMREYRDINRLPNKQQYHSNSHISTSLVSIDSNTNYKYMSKEELIEIIMMDKINEERLKKNYQIIQQAGEEKVIIYDNKNT